MASEDFLRKLRRQLKGFSREEQALLIEEIGSHIESGEQDQGLGGSPEQRQERLRAELGSPEDMGKGFQEVHRPRRFLDFLLVVLPVYLIFPLITLALLGSAHPDSQSLQSGIRIELLIGLLLLLVGSWRRSTLLLAFWIPDTIARLITLMTCEHRWALPHNGWIESALLYVALIALAGWLAWVLWRNRRDLLICAFALLPFVQTAFNASLYPATAAQSVAPHYFSWNILGIGLYQLAGVASLAGLFLLSRRSLRWMALLCGVAAYSFSLSSAAWPNFLLASAWVIPLSVYLLIGWLDLRRRKQLDFIR